MIDIHDTIALASAVERFKKPSSVLLDTFFPVIPEVSVSTWVQVDSKKGNRRLAPVIVRGAKGVNMARSDFDTKMYKAPLIAPAFTLDPERFLSAASAKVFTPPFLRLNVPPASRHLTSQNCRL